MMLLTMSTEPKYIDRKDLARLLEMSCAQVAYQEKSLGIAPARVNLKTRAVRYHRSLVMRALTKGGIVLPKEAD